MAAAFITAREKRSTGQPYPQWAERQGSGRLRAPDEQEEGTKNEWWKETALRLGAPLSGGLGRGTRLDALLSEIAHRIWLV